MRKDICWFTCGWVSDGTAGWMASLVCGTDWGVGEDDIDIWFSLVSVAVDGLFGGVGAAEDDVGAGSIGCLIESFGMVLFRICWEEEGGGVGATVG